MPIDPKTGERLPYEDEEGAPEGAPPMPEEGPPAPPPEAAPGPGPEEVAAAEGESPEGEPATAEEALVKAMGSRPGSPTEFISALRDNGYELVPVGGASPEEEGDRLVPPGADQGIPDIVALRVNTARKVMGEGERG